MGNEAFGELCHNFYGKTIDKTEAVCYNGSNIRKKGGF